MPLKVWLGFRNLMREAHLRRGVAMALPAVDWRPVERIEDCDIAIWWGLPPEHTAWIEKLRGRPYFIFEFPYWGRGNKYNLSHCNYKLTLNSLHPNRYFWQGADQSRYRKTKGYPIKPWIMGEDIVVAGMGPKGCQMYGYPHGGWDRAAISLLKESTQRRIIYRPKPSDKNPIAMDCINNDNRSASLRDLLSRSHALVTHHGNSSVEALAAGVPVFCNDGVGLLMGSNDLSQIDNPVYPENRDEFFHQLAWHQWSYPEIKNGTAFKWFIEKGLING